jgi:hypothetical protein
LLGTLIALAVSMTAAMRCILRGLVVWLIVGGAPLLRAVEKNWIAHEAKVIVVGTMHPNWPFPWIDGWHMSGRIAVDEVLYGSRGAARFGLSACMQMGVALRRAAGAAFSRLHPRKGTLVPSVVESDDPQAVGRFGVRRIEHVGLLGGLYPAQ